MHPHETNEAADLLAAVERREMPLGVYADWLEDRGDELAKGVRWLAVNERRPRKISRRLGFGWPGSSLGTPAALPKGIASRLPPISPTIREEREGTWTRPTFCDAIHIVARILNELFPDVEIIDPDIEIPQVRLKPTSEYR